MLIVAAVFVALWIGFVAFVFLARPDDAVTRRLRSVASQHTSHDSQDRHGPGDPSRTRWLLWLLLAYLAFPIDLVPDFLPVVGYADDAIITSLVLRHVLRRAGPAQLQEHWPGSPEGLATLTRLLRLPEAPKPVERVR